MRWLVLASLFYSLYIAYRGWRGGLVYTPGADRVRHMTATIAHVQLILGLWLYGISPTVRYFLSNVKEAMHDREIRFFGMEHITVMLSAIIVITIGSMVAKRKADDQAKYKAMAIWYTIGLLMILSSIPWPFSPLVSRPWLRLF
jgi:hypothetical protein